MNKIEQVIEKLCPEGVAFFALGEISTLANNGVDKKLIPSEEEVKLLNFMDVYRNRELGRTHLSMLTTASERKKIECNIKKGDIFITPSSETREDLAKASVIVEDIPNAVYSYHVMRIRFNNLKNINPSFFVHLFQSKTIQEQILELSTGMTRYGLTKPKWESLQFPVPPIEIQNEIVKILDTFSKLEAELEAELEARKKQFVYLRDELLTFDENEIPITDLGNIYDFQYGKGNTIPRIGGEFPVYGSNGIVGSHYEFNSEDSPVIGHIGAYAGIINWGSGKHFVTYNGVICTIKKNHDSRFGYHLLMKQNLRELANEGSQPFVSYDKLKSVKVQVPSLPKQIEIGKLLDSLDSLVSDIYIGLPAEIIARKKQYEYYREKLLTFKELVSV